MNLKKAKKTLLPGNTPTNGAGSMDEDEPVDKNRPVIAPLSPCPEFNSSRQAVMRTEEEENALYKDDEMAEDELCMCNNLNANIILIKYKTEHLMRDLNSPVYAFFDPTPQIIEMDGHCARYFKCQWQRESYVLQSSTFRDDGRGI